MNFRALGQAFAISVDAEVAVGTCQGGNEAGLAPDGVSIQFSVLSFQTAAMVLGTAMVGTDALGNFCGG